MNSCEKRLTVVIEGVTIDELKAIQDLIVNRRVQAVLAEIKKKK